MVESARSGKKEKSNVIFRDNMNNIHIWQGKCSEKEFERKGMHNAGSICHGREADVLLQNNPDYWAKRNLTKEQQDNLDNGYLVRKRKLHDTDDSAYDPYTSKETKPRKGEWG
jgi:hypothetical protein